MVLSLTRILIELLEALLGTPVEMLQLYNRRNGDILAVASKGR
jgi:hypothetical protein